MEKSSFFTSLNGDRKYKAEDFAEYFKTFISDGIFPNPSTNLQILANNDMTITLLPGYAWINGYMYKNDGNLTLTVEHSDNTLKRIDRVVIRLDHVNREIKAYIKKGTPANSPMAPTLQRDIDIYELGISDIFINNAVVNIYQSNITDTRANNNLCGWVNSLIKVDGEVVIGKLESEFYDWFNNLQHDLEGDIAINLSSRITAIENELDNLELVASNVTIADTNNNFASTTVEGALNELFQDVSNGKSSLATAITGKGVATSPSDTFSKMASNINSIYLGKKWASGTLTGYASGTTNFTKIDSSSKSMKYRELPVLNFVPRFVFVHAYSSSTGIETISVLSKPTAEGMAGTGVATFKTTQFLPSITNEQTQIFRAGSIVAGVAIKMPMGYDTYTSVEWFAYE